MERAGADTIKGAGPVENANMILSVLSGMPGPQRDIVVLNSAAVLLAGGKVSSFEDGVALSKSVINTGKALAKLNKLVELSKKVS